MIIDLHCHSNNSDDSLLSIDQIAALSKAKGLDGICITCLLYTSPSPRDVEESRMPSSA